MDPKNIEILWFAARDHKCQIYSLPNILDISGINEPKTLLRERERTLSFGNNWEHETFVSSSRVLNWTARFVWCRISLAQIEFHKVTATLGLTMAVYWIFDWLIGNVTSESWCWWIYLRGANENIMESRLSLGYHEVTVCLSTSWDMNTHTTTTEETRKSVPHQLL